jgi:hypothetical protein
MHAVLRMIEVNGNRWRLPEPSNRGAVFIVNEDDHPHTNCAIVAKKRRAMNPTRSAFFLAVSP